MEKSGQQKITFSIPEEEKTAVEIIDEILKNNGLGESSEEYFEKRERGIEPWVIIIRDAAITIFQVKIPEKKVVELLKKHLQCPKEAAEKIVAEIKQKLIPFAKIITEDADIAKIVPIKKEAAVKNMAPQRPQAVQDKGPDTYREPVK